MEIAQKYEKQQEPFILLIAVQLISCYKLDMYVGIEWNS